MTLRPLRVNWIPTIFCPTIHAAQVTPPPAGACSVCLQATARLSLPQSAFTQRPGSAFPKGGPLWPQPGSGSPAPRTSVCLAQPGSATDLFHATVIPSISSMCQPSGRSRFRPLMHCRRGGATAMGSALLKGCPILQLEFWMDGPSNWAVRLQVTSQLATA